MNCTACSEQLDDYVDGALPPAAARELETHLAACAGCRTQLDALRALRAATAALPRDLEPARDLWSAIAPQLESGSRPPVAASASEPKSSTRFPRRSPAKSVIRFFIPLAIAAGLAVMVSSGARHRAGASRDATWSVANTGGAPRIGSREITGDGKLAIGQWLVTDATSRARIAIGAIGQVDLAPNSRLRLINASATDHRLELKRGTLEATILAPPRLFVVETPSATATDLGCAYTLTVDDNGDGELHVTSGFVSLDQHGREAIIPAGAKCFTRTGQGPGTPFLASAPEALREALRRFDFERGAAPHALPIVLRHARAEDALTLWHLLARTSGTDRGSVFDALAKVHSPPRGVTREGILRGDAAMRRDWAAGLGFSSLLKD